VSNLASTKSRRSPRSIRLVTLVALCGLGIAACGSSSTPKPKAKPKHTASSHVTPTNHQADAAAYTKCSSQLSGLISAEKGLDARLNVGMAQAAYGTAVGNVSVAYSAINVPSLGADCLGAGAQLESAFNKYTSANTLWNNCITSPTCNDASIKPKLQADWATASADITVGQNKLTAIKAA
jgi:hypothetical protein